VQACITIVGCVLTLKEMFPPHSKSKNNKSYQHSMNTCEVPKEKSLHLTLHSWGVGSSHFPPTQGPGHRTWVPSKAWLADSPVPSSGQAWQQSHQPPRLWDLQEAPGCSVCQSVGYQREKAESEVRAGKSQASTPLICMSGSQACWLPPHWRGGLWPLPKHSLCPF
jgi:hypothetical protein